MGGAMNNATETVNPTSAFADLARQVDLDRYPDPPVDAWDPPSCGEIGLEILKDGTWMHAGDPIPREALVRLFARLLRREADGRYFVVTPVEKAPVHVARTPFIAVAMDVRGGETGPEIGFVTNVGDLVVAGPDHAITLETDGEGAVSPRVHVRRGLTAQLTRACYLELADLAQMRGNGADARWTVTSAGAVFDLGPAT